MSPGIVQYSTYVTQIQSQISDLRNTQKNERVYIILIKYAEIGIKGKNRYLFEDALVRQIKYALKKCEGEFLVHKTQGRIFVDAESEFDYDEVVAHLQRVFGISGICPVVHVQDEGFELCETVIDYIAKVYPDCNQTFKVAARRARKNY